MSRFNIRIPSTLIDRDGTNYTGRVSGHINHLSGEIEELKEYVSPEMFGAVGDGVTDDSEAFINAFLSGYKVRCDSTKTYYFEKPIDVRTLLTGHLDGNNAYFINFHMYININDEFNDWRSEYSANRFIVENMNFKNRNQWNTAPIGWETPLITTGSPMIIKNIVTSYPYVLATVDEYIDYMLCESWTFSTNPEQFNGQEINLDTISCLNKNGEYCKFSPSNDSSAGDCWRILQCNEFSLLEHPNYKMMHVYRRRPLYVDSCIQSSFVIDKFSQVIFTGCHWETKSCVTFDSTLLVNVKFINCFFYNNYILEDSDCVTYDNCNFAAATDNALLGYPMAHMTGNKLFYDMRCKLIRCNFGYICYVDTDYLLTAKNSAKKTYNWRCCGGYRKKLVDTNINVLTNESESDFECVGDYTYDIYLRTTSVPTYANDYAEKVISITDTKNNRCSAMVEFTNGGCSLVLIRTNPIGKIETTEYYVDPNVFSDSTVFNKIVLVDYGSFVRIGVEDENNTSYGLLHTPWITINAKPEFTIYESLYEANGVLVSTDDSDLNLSRSGAVQVSKDFMSM